jgi:mycothiol synthase
MPTRVEHIDTRTAPEATLHALHGLYLTWDEEMLPEDPPVPLQQRVVYWRHLLESEAVPVWVMWKGTEVVATSGLYLDLEQNLENAFGWLYVAPGHRGQGHGREIAGPMLDFAEDSGRVRLGVEIHEGRPEESLAARAGMRAAYREQRNRLSFPEVDWELMQSWMSRASERAAEYELLFLPSPMAEEHLDDFCRLTFVMNSAPRDDYEEEDEVLTPEIWRDLEAKEELRQRDVLTYVARHEPSGAFAGYTTVVCHRLQPDLVWQWDTGVDPAHRNRGLGRWLKAGMAMRLRSDFPEVRRIDTFNGGSNRPMLQINDEMGFKPLLTQTVWQGELTLIRERLSV